MAVGRRGLTVIDRTLIEVRLQDGWCIRAIARVLDRSPGMVSDEVARHGGTACYAALRQYFPEGLSLASLTQADLDTVAYSLNTRPRKTLGFDTLHERFTHLLALPSSTTPDPSVRSGS